jgi:TonB family protein
MRRMALALTARLPRALLLAGLGPALAANYQLPPAPKLDSVPQLDEALVGLRNMSWSLYSAPYAVRDSRGHSITQDVNQWLLTPEHEARIVALRSRAQSQAADATAQRATLAEAAARVHQEYCLVEVLAGYWFFQDILNRHSVRLQTLHEQLPQDDAAARQLRLAPPLKQLTDALTAAMSADSFSLEEAAAERLGSATDLVFGAYNKERGELAVALSTRERTEGKTPRTLTPEAPCQAAPVKTSGAATPKLAPGNVAPDQVYPPASKHTWFEGRVMLDATVAANGCPQRAAVYQSSGVDELDEAALRWALQAHYLPGERDHQPSDGVVRFIVKFVMTEAPSFQGFKP